MADIRLKYIGAEERYSEVAITGKQQLWLRNSSSAVSSADASLLLATGKFEQVKTGEMGTTQNLATGGPQGALDAASSAALAASGVMPAARCEMFIALVGDSRHNALFQYSPTNSCKNARHWLATALALAGRPGQIGVSYAVDGLRTDQIAGQVTSAAANGLVTDVFMKCGVNGIVQAFANGSYIHAVTGATVTSANVGATAAADMIGYMQTLVAAGKRVWIEEEEGQDSTWTGATWNAARSLQAQILNSLVESWCKTTHQAIYISWPPIYDKTVAGLKHLQGVKRDGTHDAAGGGLLKAQSFLARFGGLLPPPATTYINPSLHTYSGDPTNPIQILDNPGFATRTGGTLSSGQASTAAWTTGQTVAAGSTRVSNGGMWFTTAGGVCGATAPTGTSNMSDGTVSWIYLCPWVTWSSGATVAAKSFVVTGSKIYYTMNGGVLGTSSPTHDLTTSSNVTNGAGMNGSALLVYVMGLGGTNGSNTIPQYWAALGFNNSAYLIGTNVTADNAIEMAAIAFFTGTTSAFFLTSGSDTNPGNFVARQVLGAKYALRGRITVEDHVNIGAAHIQWSRADGGAGGFFVGTPPADGWASDVDRFDLMGRYTNVIGSYPYTALRETIPWVCDNLDNSGVSTGAVVNYNNFRFSLQGSGVGFAIGRFRDASMFKG